MGRLILGLGAVVSLVFFLALVGAESVFTDSNSRVAPQQAPLPPAQPLSTSTPSPACAPGERISWADAGRFVGTRRSVLGPIEEARIDERGAHLVMGSGPGERVYIEVVPEALSQLVLGNPDAFLNRTICVEAVVQRVEGRLTMIVSKPADLVVLTQ
jgi:hypothetical protein